MCARGERGERVPLDHRRIDRAVANMPHMGPVVIVSETDSTQADLVAEAARGGPDGLVWVAEHQTAGRGRHGRRWVDAPGRDLLLSVLLRPTLAAEAVTTVLFHAGLALREALAPLAGDDLKLKWPNDLVLCRGGRFLKLAGLLAQTTGPEGGDGADTSIALGIGINVGSPTAGEPEEIRSAAAGLEALRGAAVDRTEVLIAVLAALDGRRPSMDSARAPVEAWQAHAAWLGEEVEVDQGSRRLLGVLKGIREDGALLLELEAGTILPVGHGDLLRRRAR